MSLCYREYLSGGVQCLSVGSSVLFFSAELYVSVCLERDVRRLRTPPLSPRHPTVLRGHRRWSGRGARPLSLSIAGRRPLLDLQKQSPAHLRRRRATSAVLLWPLAQVHRRRRMQVGKHTSTWSMCCPWGLAVGHYAWQFKAIQIMCWVRWKEQAWSAKTATRREQDIINKTLQDFGMSPHLEFCIQASCPFLKKGINVLGRVQRRAKKPAEVRKFNHQVNQIFN